MCESDVAPILLRGDPSCYVSKIPGGERYFWVLHASLSWREL